MLTASKDCNLDWKVQYTQYFNMSKDYIDVLFRWSRSTEGPLNIQKYVCIDIQILKYILITISSLEFM